MPQTTTATSSSSSTIYATNHAPSFTVGSGIVVADLHQVEYGNAVQVQDDGKILVAGVRGAGVQSYYFVARFNADGTPDLAFGNAGSVISASFAVPTEKTALFVDEDGMIVFGGHTLIRVDSAGKLDTGFAVQRSMITIVENVVKQADGKYILSGYRKNPSPTSSESDFNVVVERHNADGSLDTGFNKLGAIDLSLGVLDFARATAVQADGKILVLSYVDSHTVIVRLNIDGTLDKTYGVAGQASLSPTSWPASSPTSMALQADGKLLVGGENAGGFVARLNQDGSFDETFNRVGYVEFNISLVSDIIYPRALLQQADGKIIVAGGYGFQNGGEFIALRLNSDGSLDTSFNKSGKLLMTDSGIGAVSDIALQADGSILFSASKDADMVFVRVHQDGSLDRGLAESNSINAITSYLGGANAVVLDSDARVYDYDLDGKSYENTSLNIERVGGAHAQDIFTGSGGLVLKEGMVLVNSVLIGSYKQTNGRLEIRFGALATEENVDACLRQIAYKNSNSHQSKELSMLWTFNDGSGSANASTMGVSTVKTIAAPNKNIPTSSDSEVNGFEDQIYVFKLSDFGFHDLDANDSLQTVLVSSLPASGVLLMAFEGSDVVKFVDIGDTVDMNDIVLGRLQYFGRPDENGNKLANFRVRLGDGADFSSASTVSINLAPVNDAPTGNVSMRGQFTSGQTIQASNTLADVDGMGPISYQWKIDGVAINGATKSSFTLSDSDVGKSLSVVASYVDGGGTKEFVSSAASLPIGGSFIGTLKDDIFSSTSRDESFNGLLGNDTVIYSGKIANYSVKNRGSHFEVTTKSGFDGLDSLLNIETIKFADLNINIGIQSKAAGSKPSEIANLIELYIAFFNRIPEANGLSYWIGEMQRGQKLTQIAESFFEAGASFSALTGYSKTMSDTDFINTIYKNTLGRAGGADQEGLNYWKAELASGKATRGSLVGTILASAHSFKGDATWGFVADLLDNKIIVGKKMAVDWGISYNTDTESIEVGMAVAALVTPQSTEQAFGVIGVNSLDLQLY